MAGGNIGDYVGGVGSIGIVRNSFDTFYLVYNDTGGALTNGDVVRVDLLKDVDTAAGTNEPTVSTPATATVAVVVGVVDNTLKNASTIADAAWGFVQIRGYCAAITKTTADAVAIDDYLKAANAVKTASLDSAYSAKSFAIAKSAKAGGVAGTVTGFLLGRETTI